MNLALLTISMLLWNPGLHKQRMLWLHDQQLSRWWHQNFETGRVILKNTTAVTRVVALATGDFERFPSHQKFRLEKRKERKFPGIKFRNHLGQPFRNHLGQPREVVLVWKIVPFTTRIEIPGLFSKRNFWSNGKRPLVPSPSGKTVRHLAELLDFFRGSEETRQETMAGVPPGFGSGYVRVLTRILSICRH